MTDMRFGSLQAAQDNALLCYGWEAQNGREFLLAVDSKGYGWAPVKALPDLAHRAAGRTHEGKSDGRPRKTLQPDAIAA